MKVSVQMACAPPLSWEFFSALKSGNRSEYTAELLGLRFRSREN